MKLAVTDACIFIDLIDLKITSHFFGLSLEVHTTINVWDELAETQQELLSAFRSVGKLQLHELKDEERDEMESFRFSNRLSLQDQTVIYLAMKLDAMILSSDKAVRNTAKERSVEPHGMFWIFDQLIAQGVIEKPLAASKLEELMDRNLMYRNNVKLWKEANKRLKEWKKS